MADFKDIIGHEDIIKHFKSAIELNKVSHAYILNGDPLSGKKLLASAFAKTLQCQKHGEEACLTCQSCIQSDSGNHPDIKWVTHQKSTIGVDDIRIQLNEDIIIRPYSSDYKIYIIDEADKMTVQAQNALLKTIEEPPHYVVIILLTVNADSLLQTILSRCIRLNIRPVANNLIKEYLMREKNISEDTAEFAVACSLGNVGKALNMVSSDEINEIKNHCIHLLKHISEMKVSELVESIKSLTKYKLEIYDYLDFMMMWYRDVLLYKATQNVNQLLFRDEYSTINKIAENSSYEGVEIILRELEKAKIRLRANVNFDLTMELLLLTIKEN